MALTDKGHFGDYEDYELLFFNSYSDFAYRVSGGIIISVRETTEHYTEFFVSDESLSRTAMVIEQPPLIMFRNISPVAFIDRFYSKLIDNFFENEVSRFDSVEMLLISEMLK
ncbi:MAG: hypothetical protein PUA81_00460 [Oscillospiraceae bacterium]|nr:hypothetical protein [Oscillospiraceae bacterium]